MEVYHSKIDAKIYVPMILLWSTVMAIEIGNGLWPIAALMVALAVFVAHMTLNTRYWVEGNELIIQCGFSKKKVQVDTIRRIKDTRNPLSAPATSLDRLEIMFSKYNTVMISPADKAGLVQELVALNPAIEVKVKALEQLAV